MGRRDAKRLACYVTGRWLLATDTTGLPDGTPEEMESAVSEAITEIALELMRRGGGAESVYEELRRREAF